MIHVISFPRSGNHLVRFILEYFSSKSTLGCISNPDDVSLHERVETCHELSHVQNEVIALKHHHFDLPILSEISNDTVVLILRNYKECTVRHMKGSNDEFKINPDEYPLLQTHIKDYLTILDWISKWEGKLLVIYYEDLITRPFEVLPKFLKELGFYSNEKWKLFEQNKETLLSSSVKLYDNLMGSVTKGQFAIYHKNRVDLSFWLCIDSDMKNTLPSKSIKLIERYFN